MTVKIEENENTFLLPARAFDAVKKAQARGNARPYLKGVFCDVDPEGRITLVATDKISLIKAELDENSFFGPKSSIIKMGKLPRYEEGTMVYGDLRQGVARLVDFDPRENEWVSRGAAGFSVVGEDYPDWRKAVLEGHREDANRIIFMDPLKMKPFKRAVKVLGCKHLSMQAVGLEPPIAIKFEGHPQYSGFLMPVRSW